MNYNIATGHIVNSIVSNGGKYTYTRRVSKTVADTKETSIAALAKDLHKKTSRLFSADYSSGASTNVLTKIGEFIDSYNELAKKIDSSGSKTAKDSFEQIKKTLSDNSLALSNIGISYKEGKLKLDSEKLTKIDSEYRLNTAFKGDENMLSKIMSYSKRIHNNLKSKTVLEEHPSYTSVQLTTAQTSGATMASAVFSSLDSLSRYNYSEGNRDSITSIIKSYVANYNSLITGSNDESANAADIVNEIKKVTQKYQAELDNSGINISGDLLSVDDNVLNSALMDNLKDLFSNASGYSGNIDALSRELFAEYIDASANNITLTR